MSEATIFARTGRAPIRFGTGDPAVARKLRRRILALLTPAEVRALGSAWLEIPFESRGWACIAAADAIGSVGADPMTMAEPAGGLLSRLSRRIALLFVGEQTKRAAVTAASAALLAAGLAEGLSPRQREILERPLRSVLAGRA